jgi:hypothetical protein
MYVCMHAVHISELRLSALVASKKAEQEFQSCWWDSQAGRGGEGMRGGRGETERPLDRETGRRERDREI